MEKEEKGTVHYETVELVRLLGHARKCQDGECGVDHCAAMKQVGEHVMYCRAGDGCKVPCCVSARQIFDHCQQCRVLNCELCVLAREAIS